MKPRALSTTSLERQLEDRTTYNVETTTMSAPATKSKRTAPAHPSFKDMITAAIKALADKKGSSRQAIKKYVAANYKVSDTAMKANLNKSLSKLIASKYLEHPKTGPGKYKVAKAAAAEQAKAGKKAKTATKKKPVAKKADKAGAKKAVAKKPKAKKAAVKKTAAKKSTVKKTTKKAAVKKPAAKKSPKKAAKKPAKKTAASKKK